MASDLSVRAGHLRVAKHHAYSDSTSASASRGQLLTDWIVCLRIPTCNGDTTFSKDTQALCRRAAVTGSSKRPILWHPLRGLRQRWGTSLGRQRRGGWYSAHRQEFCPASRDPAQKPQKVDALRVRATAEQRRL